MRLLLFLASSVPSALSATFWAINAHIACLTDHLLHPYVQVDFLRFMIAKIASVVNVYQHDACGRPPSLYRAPQPSRTTSAHINQDFYATTAHQNTCTASPTGTPTRLKTYPSQYLGEGLNHKQIATKKLLSISLLKKTVRAW